MDKLNKKLIKIITSVLIALPIVMTSFGGVVTIKAVDQENSINLSGDYYLVDKDENYNFSELEVDNGINPFGKLSLVGLCQFFRHFLEGVSLS